MNVNCRTFCKCFDTTKMAHSARNWQFPVGSTGYASVPPTVHLKHHDYYMIFRSTRNIPPSAILNMAKLAGYYRGTICSGLIEASMRRAAAPKTRCHYRGTICSGLIEAGGERSG